MISYDEILQNGTFSLSKDEKTKLFNKRLKDITILHYHNCEEYKKILDARGIDPMHIDSYADVPFITTSAFKEMDLKSISEKDVFKTMTSSGTSGQAVSKIFLDRNTANNQQKTLVKIVSDFTGSVRMPMLIIDSPSVLKDRKMFSARGAGILGFSMFGTDRTYALHEDMSLDTEALKKFVEKHRDERILIFGFTFMIWQHFYQELLKNKMHVDLSNAVMIHGGGWKKLASESVSTEDFKHRLQDVCGLSDIHDYYGMVEQTGCIYMECKEGHLHASSFSDVIMRRQEDFSKCDLGEKGIIQVLSLLPESYPGHSLLTQDEGIILGEDDCPCGRKGKYFKVLGRLENAEIRGCSDTYATDFK